MEDLLDGLVGDDEWARERRLERLREDGASREDVAALIAAVSGDDATRRAAARMALAALASPGSRSASAARAALVNTLGSPDPDVRVLGASALGESGDPAAGPALVRVLETDPEENVVAAAADALGHIVYAPAVKPLVRAALSPSFWVRAAAVVTLGSLEDERALAGLRTVAEERGLERPLVEALRRINHPDALPVLEIVSRSAPDDALLAAGWILAAHPDVEPPGWVRTAAAAEEDTLRRQLAVEDDPAVARLLGIVGTDSAVETLADLAGPPRRSEAALIGILAVPSERRARALAERLERAEGEDVTTLLTLLPAGSGAELVPVLVRFLSDSDAAVRAAAAEAIARTPPERARPLLEAQLERTDVAPEVVRALGRLGSVVCAALLPLLDDPDARVRGAAADALARCADPSLVGPLGEALDREPDGAARCALIRALGHVGAAAAVDRLATALEQATPEARLAAIEGLGATGSEAALPALRPALAGTTSERIAALRSIGQLGIGRGLDLIAPHLADEDPDVRRAAALAATRVPGPVPDAVVERLLGDPDHWVRVSGVRLLRDRSGPGPDRLAIIADHDPSPAVRAEARRAISRER